MNNTNVIKPTVWLTGQKCQVRPKGRKYWQPAIVVSVNMRNGRVMVMLDNNNKVITVSAVSIKAQ